MQGIDGETVFALKVSYDLDRVPTSQRIADEVSALIGSSSRIQCRLVIKISFIYRFGSSCWPENRADTPELRWGAKTRGGLKASIAAFGLSARGRPRDFCNPNTWRIRTFVFPKKFHHRDVIHFNIRVLLKCTF